MNPIILNILIAFLLRQINKWGKKIDWEKVKATLAERVPTIVPGTMFDEAAVIACNTLIDLVAEYFKDHVKENVTEEDVRNAMEWAKQKLAAK